MSKTAIDKEENGNTNDSVKEDDDDMEIDILH